MLLSTSSDGGRTYSGYATIDHRANKSEWYPGPVAQWPVGPPALQGRQGHHGLQGRQGCQGRQGRQGDQNRQCHQSCQGRQGFALGS